MVAIHPNVCSVFNDDGAVILDINKDQFFSLNPVGAFIWTGLLGGQEIDQIIKALAAETGMEPSIVTADVDAFIAGLTSMQLLDLAV